MKFHRTDSKMLLTSSSYHQFEHRKRNPTESELLSEADLLLIKNFINSTISTDGAKFAMADLSNFYLMTPLKRPEYGRVKLTDIPDEIILRV